MKTLTAILALAGVAGVGYYVYKKINDKKEDDNTTAYTEYKESYGDKVRRASMYAVGTIKTTADKISEGIKQVKSEDMVKKGEEAVEQMKETTGEIKEHVKETTGGIKEHVKETAAGLKEDIKGLKNLVTSINTTPADAPAEEAEGTDEEEDSIPEISGEVSDADSDLVARLEEVLVDEDDENELFASSDPEEQL